MFTKLKLLKKNLQISYLVIIIKIIYSSVIISILIKINVAKLCIIVSIVHNYKEQIRCIDTVCY